MRTVNLLPIFIVAVSVLASDKTEINVPTTQAAEPVTALITLKAEAVSAGDHVVLKEIAAITAPDDQLQALGQLVIGRAAQAGQKRVFSIQDVESVLNRGSLSNGIKLEGARSVNVTAASAPLSGREIADAAIKAVRAVLAGDKELEVEIEVLNLPSDVQLRPGPRRITPEIAPGSLRPGMQSIRVKIMQGDLHLTDVSVGLRLHITGILNVAAENLLAGDILDEVSIKNIRKELTPLEFQSRGSASKLIGMRLKRNMNTDEPLLRSNFAMPQVIKRGEAVTVYVRRGGLELATRGEAKNDACLEDTVKVFVEDSGAEVIARASGIHEATINDPSQR